MLSRAALLVGELSGVASDGDGGDGASCEGARDGAGGVQHGASVRKLVDETQQEEDKEDQVVLIDLAKQS